MPKISPTSKTQTQLAVKEKRSLDKVPLYRVILHNDDYTPMDFVTQVLQKFFHKTLEEADAIMLHVHHKGFGVCGIYPYDIAETKVDQVSKFSQKNHHPLQCTCEKDDL